MQYSDRFSCARSSRLCEVEITALCRPSPLNSYSGPLYSDHTSLAPLISVPTIDQRFCMDLDLQIEISFFLRVLFVIFIFLQIYHTLNLIPLRKVFSLYYSSSLESGELGGLPENTGVPWQKLGIQPGPNWLNPCWYPSSPRPSILKGLSQARDTLLSSKCSSEREAFFSSDHDYQTYKVYFIPPPSSSMIFSVCMPE